MTEPIDYLKQLTIIDDWGEQLVNVILKGMSLQSINTLKDSVKLSLRAFLLGADAYFLLLFKNQHLPGNRDIVGAFSLRDVGNWTYSFNQILGEIRTLESAYASTVRDFKTYLPFIYIFSMLPAGETFEKPEDIYDNAERRIYGNSLKRMIEIAIQETFDRIAGWKRALVKYWRSFRWVEMEARVKALTFRDSATMGRIWCYERPPTPAGLSRDLEGLKLPAFRGGKDNYVLALQYEDDLYSGVITGVAPAPYALNPLPERPIRPTTDEIMKEIEDAHPPIENRDFTEKEIYCMNRVDKLDSLKRERANYFSEMNNIGCKTFLGICQERDEYGECIKPTTEIAPGSKGDPFYCIWLGNAAQITERNLFVLFSKIRYPEPWEDKLTPIPEFVEPTQRERDRLTTVLLWHECSEMSGTARHECFVKYYNLVKSYNEIYKPINPSLKDSHRFELVSLLIDFEIALNSGTQPTLGVDSKLFMAMVENYERIYGWKLDFSQQLPPLEDWTNFEHADPSLLAKEQEYKAWLKNKIRGDEHIAINAAAEKCGLACENLRGWQREAQLRGMNDFFRARIVESQQEVKIDCADYRSLKTAYINKYGEAPPVTSRYTPC